MSAAGGERRVLDEAHGSRAMTWVMAIMLFLTVLAAAIGLGTATAGRLLDRTLAGRLSVQVTEGDAEARDAAARRIVGALSSDNDVARVRQVPRAEMDQLLRPWLGDAAGDAGLPVPAMVDVALADAATASRVAARIRSVVPGARVDADASWLGPIRGVIRSATLLATLLVVLMAAATASVVVLAARAGLETHRATIEVMHMLGSTDLQVARLFQRRIGIDAAVGGAIGGLAALLVAALLQSQLAALGSELLGGAALGRGDWIILALLPIAFVALAVFAARAAVLRRLRRIL